MEKEKHVFLALDKENKLIKTNEEQADYVRIPIDDYYEMLKEEITADGTGTISIPINEYNGYQKAIRIIRDRSLQQIDKEKADENGYTLRYAEKRKYNYESGEEAYLITKTTPHSIKILPEDAIEIIEGDLIRYYKFVGLPQFADDDVYSGLRTLTEEEVIQACNQYNNPMWKYDFLLVNSNTGRAMMRFFDKYKGKVAFKTTKMNPNFLSGTYDITYWATSII